MLRKGFFSDRGSDDPFAPTVQRHRDEQARAAPSFGRNPNVDARLRGRPAWNIPSTPPRVVPAMGAPPGEWVPGRERDAAARAEAARAAAAALPYADNRRRNLLVAAAASARPTVAPERPRADPVVHANRERTLPPRREPFRGPQGRLLVHPENPRYVRSFLEISGSPARRMILHIGERGLDLFLLDRIEIRVMTPTE